MNRPNIEQYKEVIKNGSIGQYLDIYPTQTVEELEKKISEL